MMSADPAYDEDILDGLRLDSLGPIKIDAWKEVHRNFQRISDCLHTLGVRMELLPGVRTFVNSSFTTGSSLDLSDVPTTTNSLLMLTTTLLAKRNAVSESYFWKITSCFKNEAGTVSQVGTTVNEAIQDDAATDLISFAHVISGAIIKSRVSTASGTGVTFSVKAQHVAVHEMGF